METIKTASFEYLIGLAKQNPKRGLHFYSRWEGLPQRCP